MKNTRKKAIAILSTIIISLGVFIFSSANNIAHAADTGSTINKWMVTQYYQCIRDGGWQTTVNSKTNGDKVSASVFPSSGTYYLPSYSYGHSVSSGSVNCLQVAQGTSGVSGFLSSDPTWKNPGDAQTLLNNLGYEVDQSSQTKNFTIVAKTHKVQKYWSYVTGEMITESDGETSTVVVSTAPNSSGGRDYTLKDAVGNFFNNLNIKFENHSLTVKTDSHWLLSAFAGYACTMGENQSATFPLLVDVEAFRDSIQTGAGSLANRTWFIECTSSDFGFSNTVTTYYNFEAGEIVNMGDAGKYTYKDVNNRYPISNDAAQKIAGMTLAGAELSNTEKYNMYLHYLQNAIPSGVQNRLTSNPTDKTNLTKIKLKSTSGDFKDFYANFNGTDPATISVYIQTMNGSGSNTYPVIVESNMKEIIDWFNSVDTSTLEEVDMTEDDNGPTPPNPNPDPDDDSGTSNEEICYQGAGSLGWIMCPVIMATSELADKVYDTIEKDYLQIQTTSIFDSNNGVQKVWATFRNLANVLFAIFLTIIIFSQLTGLGIDNYGIKKMLPRLIIAAILINFSYIICQILVDVSNILGASLKNFLETGLNVASAPGASGVGVGVASVIWAAGVAAFFFVNPAAVSTLLLILLSMVIAILFLWLILIARQAGVVICIVISPIMLIFYMLPNMDKVFRKWVDIMKGLLLLYPICGLVVGGGKLAGAILSNVGDGSWKVAAMIVQVVPYFMIPSLLRGSINAINGLGDKLGNMGARGQQKAFNKMYNSETMDRARTAMNASNAFGRRDLADKINKTKFGKVLGRPFYKSITRANQKKRAYQEDDQKASNTMQQVMFESAEQKDQKRIVRDRANGIDTTSAAYQGSLKSTPAAILEQIRQANANNDEERFNSLVTEYQRRTSASKTAEMLAQLVDDEQNNGILGGAKRADFMRRLAQTHASTLAKTPDLKQYLQTGGIDSTGNHISFNDGTSSYMQRNFNGADDGFKIGDLKDNDVVGAGSGAIARMISSGQLTQPQAQRIMASKANREKMDDVQQLLLGAYARNGAQISKNDAEKALLNNTDIGGFTSDQIKAMLEDGGDDVVIRDVRWRNQDGIQQQTDPLIIKHDDLDTSYSGADTLKKYQDMIQQRVNSGNLTQEQADKFIQQAKDRLRQKNNP